MYSLLSSPQAVRPPRAKWFANVEMSAISNEMIQQWISQRTEYSPKTISNHVTTLQRIWNKATKWKYLSGDSPFEDLSLPKPELRQQASLTLDQIREIITRAPEPYLSGPVIKGAIFAGVRRSQ
jgi:site-specific recombinase XerD